MTTALLSVDAAQAQLLAAVDVLPIEQVGLVAARDRLLAADLVALRTQPPFAMSAMDGYAIRWADRAGPWTLVGESAAGRRFAGVVGTGETARILTGAPLPAGADTVVVQEDIARDGAVITLVRDGPPRQGAHIRRAGLDFLAGDVVDTTGTRITPARIGLLAAAGHGHVPVPRRPRVVLLATGDELVPPGEIPGPDQIVSSNGVMLAALFAAAGADVVDGGIIRDDPEALAAALTTNADADMLVTIGGASVGDHDHVLAVLRSVGAEIAFWKIAIKPGKPMIAGRLGRAQVIGLPGNPVSAFVCAQLFVLPMLRRMQGAADPLPPTTLARLGVALPQNGDRRDHLRATLHAGIASPATTQDSSMLRALAVSNVLIIREPHVAASPAGTEIRCILLDSDSGVA